MQKTALFNWQIAIELKQALETIAKEEQLSLAQLLERIVRDWLKRYKEAESDAAQQKMRDAAAQAFGTFNSHQPDLSTTASQRIRQSLKQHYESPGTH